MKRCMIIMLVVAAFSITKANAQGGYDYINAGVGVSGWGIPLFVSADYTVQDHITVGVMVSGQRRSRKRSIGTDSYREIHSILGINANGNYHFFEPNEPYDVYLGASVGYYFWSVRYTDLPAVLPFGWETGGNGGVGISLQAGGRYRLDNGWILFGQVGGGTQISGALVGVSFPIDYPF